MTSHRNDSTAHNAKRAFTVTVDGVGQVFASDALGNALEVLRERGVGANLVYNYKFHAFVDDTGKVRPCASCSPMIAGAL